MKELQRLLPSVYHTSVGRLQLEIQDSFLSDDSYPEANQAVCRTVPERMGRPPIVPSTLPSDCTRIASAKVPAGTVTESRP